MTRAMPNDAKKIPVLSFFSGAGFLDIGFLRQNMFEIVWHNECYAPFADAYEHGVGGLEYNTYNKIQSRARIENLRAKKIIDKAFDGTKPEQFGVIGGPPCPDFSRAGKNGGGRGENGRLTGKFVRMVINLAPSFFLLENVPGLLEIKKHRKFLFSLLKKLDENYAVDVKVLNALEYGVPQNRRRVFIVGINKEWLGGRMDSGEIKKKSRDIVDINISENRAVGDVAKDLSKLHWFCWPQRKFPNIKTKYAWKSKKDSSKQLTVEHCFSKINGHPNAKDTFKPHSKKFEDIKEGDTSRKSFKRLHRYSYSPNVAYGNNEVHLHPTENRRISVAEALSLQSVPGKYCFPDNMSLTAKFKAVGNGVPVLLAECVAKSIWDFLQEGKQQ